MLENAGVSKLPPNAGKGRVKGVPNKVTRTVREAFEQVFIALQEHDTASLLEWSKREPEKFYQLAARLIPAEMNIGLTNSALAERIIAARKRTLKAPSDGSDLA